MFLVMAALAAALPMCGGEQVNLRENCTIVTPSLSCGNYTYDIVNLTGVEVVNNASLTGLNNSLYYFNFTHTQEKSDYMVVLCDGTTREVRVRTSGENMTWPVAAAILLFGVIYLIYRASVDLGEEHWHLKMGMFYFSLALGWAALNVAVRFAKDNLASTGLQDSIEVVYLAYTAIAVLAFAYLIIRILAWLFYKLAGKRVEGYERGW